MGFLFLLPLQLFSVFDAETANPPFLSGVSIYRVAFGYLPNPRIRRRRHLKNPLRLLLLLKRPLPPRWRWRCPRLGEPGVSCPCACACAHDDGRDPGLVLKKESRGNEKITKQNEGKKCFGLPLFFGL